MDLLSQMRAIVYDAKRLRRCSVEKLCKNAKLDLEAANAFLEGSYPSPLLKASEMAKFLDLGGITIDSSIGAEMWREIGIQAAFLRCLVFALSRKEEKGPF